MFVGKVRTFPIEEPFRNKHLSLLRKGVTYGTKKFYNIGPRGLYNKTSSAVNNSERNKLERLSLLVTINLV